MPSCWPTKPRSGRRWSRLRVPGRTDRRYVKRIRSPHEPDRVLHARWRYAGPVVPDVAPISALTRLWALIRATILNLAPVSVMNVRMETRTMLCLARVAVTATFVVLCTQPTRSQSVAEFYRGKTIEIQNAY